MTYRALAAFVLLLTLTPGSTRADERTDRLKQEAYAGVEERAKLAQEMVDSIFSFGELGFQEYETSRYVTGILEDNGFAVERGVAGMPTAWTARWGSGKPVIAFGSDIDGIPKASQKPGVAYHDPILEGAPGHGEGHNSGQAVNVVGGPRGQRSHGAGEYPRARSCSGRASLRSNSEARRSSCETGLFEDVDLDVLHARCGRPQRGLGPVVGATASSPSSTRSAARRPTARALRGSGEARSMR